MSFSIRKYLSFALCLVLSAVMPLGAYCAEQGFVLQNGTQIIDASHLIGSDSLSVSSGATLIIDFGTTSGVSIPGNISNSGTIYAISSNGATTTGSLAAQNVFNNQGAMLTTVLPSGGIPGVGFAVGNFNLSLFAAQNIMNYGTISSAGNLSMVAVNGITNQGIMSAIQNVNITAGVAGLINSGLISSATGSINITNIATQNLLVNNTGGQLQALLGDINIRAQGSSESNINVFGGDFLSKELNLTAPGNVDVAVQQLTGRVNVDACALHIQANSEDLTIGNINLTGDPTFYNTGGDVSISGDISLPAQNLAIVASGDIITAGGNWQINTSASGLNAGSILMVAGANFTSSGAPSVVQPAAGDTSSTLTILGASATGGNIDLTGGGTNPITAITTAVTSGNGSGGSLTMAAFADATGAKGTISVPSTVTINTGTANNSIFSANGNVTMIAGAASGNAIQVGGINTSGNIVNSSLSNGTVYLASGTPSLLGNPSGSATSSTFTNPTLSGTTQVVVTSAAGLSVGQTININPFGTNAEQAQITAITGTTLTLSAPLANNHAFSESVLVTVPSVVVSPGAGIPGNATTMNGGTFGVGTVQSGNISVGAITAGGNVVLASNAAASAGNGAVNLNGAVTLTQNPTSQVPPTAYLNNPAISISAQTLNVAAAGSVTSQILGCTICQDSLTVNAPTINNAGTMSSNNLSLSNSTGDMIVNNTGTISGSGSNPMVAITSAGNLTLTGTGTLSGQTYSVIELSAADTKSLNLSSSQTVNFAGPGSVLILNAQAAGGAVNVADAAQMSVSGAPLININTPNLNLGNGSAISATGASNFVITSGAISASPQTLTVTVASGGTSTLSTSGGSRIIFRPTDGQNLIITSPTAGATLNLTGAPVYYFTATDLVSGATGQTQLNSNVTVSASGGTTTVANPNGGITGIAFEPYVGLATPSPPNFTLFSAYSYAQTILLLAPIVSTGLFQSVSTYTQGAFLPIGGNPANISAYEFSGAAKYIIGAAKQVGMQVSAGAFVENPDKSVNVVGTSAEINYALAQATKYGNVLDLVVGNECIVGGASPQASTTNLIQAINYAQVQRNATTSFTSATLPVTTRQTYGVLSGATSFQSTVDLLNGCTNCYGITGTYAGTESHVYGNVYPYFDQPVLTALAANPGITQGDFTTLVTNQIQADLNGTLSAFATKAITPKLRVGETGWATTSTPAGQAPQANATWAQWYYPAMQAWSATNKSKNQLDYQVPINGYFESFDEPWKYTTTAGQGGEPNFGIWTAVGTTSTTVGQQYNLTGVVEKFALPIYNPAPPSPPQTSTALNTSAVSSHLSTNLNTAIAPSFSLNSFDSALQAVSNLPSPTILPTDINPQTQPQTTVEAFTTLSSIDSSFFALGTGHTLIAPNTDVKLSTGLANVSVDAGAAALVLNTATHVVILALHDDTDGSVRVSVDGAEISLPVGRQLVLTKDGVSGNGEANRIGRRSAKSIQLGKLTAEISEFSLPSALSSLKTLQMLRSAKKEERLLAQKLLKTAAAMMVVSKNQTPFTPNK